MAKNATIEKKTKIFDIVKILKKLFIGGVEVTSSAAELNILDGVTKTAAQINLLVAGAAAGYKIARGVAAVTGTATVATGLATVVAVVATPSTDPDGTSLAAVSATIGNQSGAPVAGSVILNCWKITAADNGALVAADAEKSVNWIAIGT